MFLKFTDPLIVTIDAPDTAIGEVLSQIQDGYECVLAYWIWQLQKAERNYSTIKCEALTVVSNFTHFLFDI